MNATRIRIHAIAQSTLDDVRANAKDDQTEPAIATGGEPLRCCLRDAAPGERLLLFGYEPSLPPSPYRETGAVFAHADACAAPADPTRYPADWLGRPQVLRAYDERGWIHPASRQHDGSEPEQALAQVLAEPGVVQVHSRNIVYGCYMFAATRADGPTSA
jgi:hypothetical protein